MNKELGSEWRDWILNPCGEVPISEPQTLQLQPTERELQLQRMLENEEEKVLRMQQAIDNLYFAAWWSPDRACDAARLWDELRDAAEIDEGAKTYLLGEDHSGDAQTVTDFVNVEYLENQVESIDAELRTQTDWAQNEILTLGRAVSDLIDEVQKMRQWQKARIQWEEDLLHRVADLTDAVRAFQVDKYGYSSL